MLFGTWLRKQLVGTQLQDLAECLAIRCIEPTWQRINATVLSMSLAESRGYIQARSAVVLHHALQQLCAEQPGITTRTGERLREMAAEMLIERLERRVFECRRQSLARRMAA